MHKNIKTIEKSIDITTNKREVETKRKIKKAQVKAIESREKEYRKEYEKRD